MDSMKFISDLVIQFKDKKDPERNRVFYEALTNFTSVCPEDKLQDVYTYIIKTHTYSTPFQVGKIWKYAAANGYIEEKKRKR